MVAQTDLRALAEGLHADLDPRTSLPGACRHALGAHSERPVVHVPDRERERRQRLEILLGQHLLAIAEIDRASQLVQLRQRSEVHERRATGVRTYGVLYVAQQRRLPAQVTVLLAITVLLATLAHPEADTAAVGPTR